MKIASRSLSWLAGSFIFLLSCVLFLCHSKIAFAELQLPSEDNQSLNSQEREYLSTLQHAINSATTGPAKINLIDQGSLDLPDNYLFVPKKEASDFMKANGNQTGPEFVGLILPKDDDMRWLIIVDFIKSGYVRDDDAKDWSADNLLKSIKAGTAEDNKDRVANGFSPLEILGWVESPKYDASKHQLIWSMLAKNTDSKEPVVNYNTYVLGREGYFKLNLITNNSTIAQDKKYAHKMLAALHYNDGKRYQDFTAGRDRVAEYGLAALITGVAAKKLGLLALIGAFLIKAWKIFVLIPLLFWNKIKKIFGKNA